MIFLSVGWVKFWYPFQILNLGGTESYNSISGSLYALGQILGYLILSSIISKMSTRYLVGNFFFAIFLISMSLSSSPEILLLTRLLEGLGFSMLFLAVIQFSDTMQEEVKGEVIGSLFSAIFSGLAVGQAIAGIFEQVLSSNLVLAQETSIKIMSAGAFIIVVLIMIILRIDQPELKERVTTERKLNHSHPSLWKKVILGSPAILMLFIIYSLYDFAHGIYTPNLSIMLNQQGISEVNLGFAYFVGDFTWGVSQIFAGKWIDRIGYSIPLLGSLVLKGLTVIFYTNVTAVIFLFMLLFLAGLAEGLLEPSRNKAALTVESNVSILHYHGHLDIGFSASGNIVFGHHNHEHEHEIKPDKLIAALQSIGMMFFGLGSLIGSWLLSLGLTLEDLTYIGGVALMLAGIISLLFNREILPTYSK
ncbi:MAG: MFS transporter [Candidatus Heimdallarchaeota archaeon]|nr:MFS transporter [Candidatus Heimdallarchaeota archaeon]